LLVGDDADVLCNAACPGTGAKNFINPHNINSFIGCTVIQGEIRILPTTFYGFALLLFLFHGFVIISGSGITSCGIYGISSIFYL